MIRNRRTLLGLAAALSLAAPAMAQPVGDSEFQLGAEGFVTSTAAQQWEKWQAAMRALLARQADAIEKAFAEYLALEASPLRTALLAERTVKTPEAGAVLLLEQDIEAGSLGENGKKVGDLLVTGREQLNQADDGFYFASIGRFDVADANFKALLGANPDPVALLEFADTAKRRDLLIQLVPHAQMGESARGINRLLVEGERRIKADPGRIRQHIDRLAGPPRAFENALDRLKESGEYAIPFLVEVLRDPSRRDQAQAILRAIPLIDRAALNPLVMALRMEDQTTRRFVIQALGRIPYPQSLPYLLKLRDDPQTPPEVQSEVQTALRELRSRGVDWHDGLTAAKLFYELAEAYYADRGSLAADPTLETANVWYWRNDMLVNVPVPTQIFNEVMAMRTSEEALLLEKDMKEPLALWLAANFRREAQLLPDQTDATRPENYPSGAYFARSGGAEYSLMVLDRAVHDGDPAVALGAIDALHRTAGPASLVSEGAGGVPLGDALTFPNRVVRIRAGLALGNANPQESFRGSQNLPPVLSEALMLHGGSRNALVVDADEAAANAAAGALRAEGYNTVVTSGLFEGLERVRAELPGLDVIFIASDIRNPELEPGLRRLRDEFAFRNTPVVIVSKAGERGLVRRMVRADHRLAEVLPDDAPERIKDAIARVSHAVGVETITPELGGQLAQETAEALRLLASTYNPVFDLTRVQPALIAVVESTKDATLRITVAQVLGYLGTPEAQEAIARIALDTSEEQAMRIAMFDALAQAAKRGGSRLGEEAINALIQAVESEADMEVRTAASQALGALNLPANKAADLIRNQYAG